MIRRPPRSTRTYTLFTYTTLVRSIAVDNSGVNQRIILKTESYLLLIHIHWDKGLLAFHYIGERNAARAAENPAQLTSADGFVLLVHHEDFPEISGKVVMFTQIVDHLTNRHIFGHRDQIAQIGRAHV